MAVGYWDVSKATLAALVIAFLLLVSGCWCALRYRDLREAFELRNATLTRDIKFIREVCDNVVKMREVGAEAECDRRTHAVAHDPWEEAKYDVMEQVGLCGRGGCMQWAPSGFSLAMAVAVASITAITTVLILLRVGGRQRYEYALPEVYRNAELMRRRQAAYEADLAEARLADAAARTVGGAAGVTKKTA